MPALAASRLSVLEAQLAAAEETGRCFVEVGVCELRGLLELQRLMLSEDGAERLDVLLAVAGERARQERLHADGRFAWTCADESIADSQKLAVLVEEVGEVAQEVQWVEAPDAFDLDLRRLEVRDELIHVAAVAVAWLESMP